METIHVCYAIHDRTGHYCKFLGTSIYSMLKNTGSKVMIHILCDSTLSQENMDRLVETAKQFQQQIAFYSISGKERQEVSQFMQRLPKAVEDIFTPACLYRLILWSILPDDIQKIIYLDADIIVHMDVLHLWNEPASSGGLSAVVDLIVKEIPEKKCMDIFDKNSYFNSGVLVMQRESFVLPEWNAKILWFLQNFPNLYYDQDVLNYFYADRYRSLDSCYNTLVGYERYHQRKGIKQCIYHYSGPAVTLDFDDVYNQLFFRYFTETPWCNADFLRRMWSVAEQLQRSRARALQQAARSFPRRKRMVFGPAEDREAIARILQLKPDETYAACRPGLSVDFAALESMRGSVVVLLFGESYEELGPTFGAKGWEEGVDFFPGDDFLLPEEGGLLMDTYGIFSQL